MHGGDRLISKRTPFSAKLRFCNLCIIKQTNYNKLLFSCSKDRQRRVFRIWMPPTLRSSLLWWLAGRRRLTLKPLRLKVRTANKTKELRWWSHHIFLHDAPACIQGTNSQSFFGVWPCSFVIPTRGRIVLSLQWDIDQSLLTASETLVVSLTTIAVRAYTHLFGVGH